MRGLELKTKWLFLNKKKYQVQKGKNFFYLTNFTFLQEKWYTTVQDRLTAYFDNPENKSKLSVLSVKGLNYALGQCVEKGDNKSFESVVKYVQEQKEKQ